MGQLWERTDATISDVAKAAGVATSTVSRALTRPGRVSEGTRQRIVAVAAELGYRANPQARSLTSGRTQTIALLIPDVTNPFFFDLIRGTQSRAKAKGYRHLLVDTEESADVEAATIADLRNAVDGIVLAASRLSDNDLVSAAERVPLVVVNRTAPGVPAVVMDTSQGMQQAVGHLASLGHRSVAYLGGPSSSWSSRRRWRAIMGAADRLGVRAQQIGPFSPTTQAGAAAADAAIHHGVTACIFFNDLLAIGALRRFMDREMRVPEDMSVVGCDDIFGAAFCNPPLTTLTAPIEHAGRIAIDMLLTELNSSSVLSRHLETLPTHLTIRASTGPARDKVRS